jgi:hypothetical protein
LVFQLSGLVVLSLAAAAAAAVMGVVAVARDPALLTATHGACRD